MEASSTITALQVFGSALYDASSYLEDQGARGWVLSSTRLVANTYYDSSGTFQGAVFFDPMDDILNSFREVTLRMSVAAAADGPPHEADEPAVPYSQTVLYTSQLEGVQFKADRGNLALAVVISLLGPVATLALFWGWWQLGRPFSLSPMEVVNAFYPPTPDAAHAEARGHAVRILAGCNGNATAGEVIKHVREGRNDDPLVCYGIVGDANRLCMGLANDGTVRRPGLGDEL